MTEFTPKPDESALEFVERAEASGLLEDTINIILREHFGLLDDGDIKSLKLKSEVFWHTFFAERVKAILERGGSRYAAVRFIERKNGKAGQRVLSDKEIQGIVDAAGNWSK